MALPSPTKIFHQSSYPSISPTRPELSTSGKVVLITGGGSGIGSSVAAAFADAGSKKIAILGRTLATLATTAASLESSHPGLTILPLIADINDEKAVNDTFKTTVEQLGPIDILVSNAAYMSDRAYIAEAKIDNWWKGFETNIKGSFIVMRAFLAHRATKSTFISFSTFAAHLFAQGPLRGFSSYAASKLTIIKLAEYLAAEYEDVRVFSVHPGAIMTEMGQKAKDGGVDFALDDPDLPGAFAVWLASPESEFLRGRMLWSNWDVDELLKRKEEFGEGVGDKFKIGLLGWP